MMDTLRILSYNPTGLGLTKLDYLNDLLVGNDVDIMLMQETWLSSGTMNRLNKINKDYNSYGLSGMDEEQLLYGRPYGGIAILWKNTLNYY